MSRCCCALRRGKAHRGSGVGLVRVRPRFTMSVGTNTCHCIGIAGPAWAAQYRQRSGRLVVSCQVHYCCTESTACRPAIARGESIVSSWDATESVLGRGLGCVIGGRAEEPIRERQLAHGTKGLQVLASQRPRGCRRWRILPALVGLSRGRLRRWRYADFSWARTDSVTATVR